MELIKMFSLLIAAFILFPSIIRPNFWLYGEFIQFRAVL